MRKHETTVSMRACSAQLLHGLTYGKFHFDTEAKHWDQCPYSFTSRLTSPDPFLLQSSDNQVMFSFVFLFLVPPNSTTVYSTINPVFFFPYQKFGDQHKGLWPNASLTCVCGMSGTTGG